MAAVYNGALTFGECCPGFYSSFTETGVALEVLRDEVVLHLPCFLEALAAMAGLELQATASIQAQLQVALNFNLQLGLTLPTVYLDALIKAKIQLLLGIQLLLPDITLNLQLAIIVALILDLNIQIELIVAAFAAVVIVLRACYVALLGVAVAAFVQIQDFQAAKRRLATTGFYALAFTGALAGLGADLNAQIAASNLPPTAQILATVQFIRTADSSARGAQAAIFGADSPSSMSGTGDVSETIPGASATLLEVGAELESLRDEILEHVGCLNEVIDLLAIAEAAAAADLRARLAAAVALEAQLTITLHDPVAYIAGLIEAVAGITFSLNPVVAIQAQIDASASVSAGIQAKLDFIAGVFAQITAKLNACYAAMLNAAVAATPTLEDYNDMKASLDTAGAYSFTYTGTASGLGAALNAVTPSTGLAGAEVVSATVQLTRTTNASAYAAHRQLFLAA